jgi:hypothetical protein
MALETKFSFDDKNYRHYLNGFMTVLHCHHYMSLVTKTAIENDMLGGTRILAESAEDSVRPMFDDYILKHQVNDSSARLQVGSEYYSVMGMGMMKVKGSALGGEVELVKSHVDQGWLLKFGKSDKPINHFTRGYIAAMFAAAFGKPARSYKVVESAGMVTGEPTSKFVVTVN